MSEVSGETLRERVLEAFAARLSEIRVEAGTLYRTNAGDRVYIGEAPSLGDDDPPSAVVVVIGDVQATDHQMGTMQQAIAVECQAHVRISFTETIDSNPFMMAEALLGDIVRAVEQADRTLGSLSKGPITLGPTRSIPRETGSTTVAVGQTYLVPIVRRWGQP